MISYSGLFGNITSFNYIIVHVFKNKLLTVSVYEAAEIRGVLISTRADLITYKKMAARAVMQGGVSVPSSKTVWVLKLQSSLPHTREDIKTLID